MPTTRPRHTITETDKVSRALRKAAKRWPAERNTSSKLLLRLIEEGEQAIEEQEKKTRESRRAAVLETSGALTGVYGENYLAELRKDWPE